MEEELITNLEELIKYLDEVATQPLHADTLDDPINNKYDSYEGGFDDGVTSLARYLLGIVNNLQ